MRPLKLSAADRHPRRLRDELSVAPNIVARPFNMEDTRRQHHVDLLRGDPLLCAVVLIIQPRAAVRVRGRRIIHRSQLPSNIDN